MFFGVTDFNTSNFFLFLLQDGASNAWFRGQKPVITSATLQR